MLWLFAFAAAQTDLQGQFSNQFGCPPQVRGKTGKTRKANAANKPAHYTYEVLYNSCCHLGSGLIRDAAGNLYTATYDKNAVFELDPAGNVTVLYRFCSKPNCADGEGANGLVMDSAGNIYGTAASGGAPDATGGVVFELTPPAQPGGVMDGDGAPQLLFCKQLLGWICS